jgi:transposase
MNQTKVIPNIEVEDIDHLGIIAGIIDDIGIVDIINKRVGEHTQEQVSAGHVVKALILNCMGFLSAPLYLFHQFFVGKGTEHLLGEGIKAEYLNARRIGRVLDKLYQQGITTIFMTIAVSAVQKFGVSMSRVHGDSSSFYVHGEYEAVETASVPEAQETPNSQAPEAQETPESDFVPIEIVRGYSRDHRPDLKQFTLNLITSSDGDIPLGMRVGNGNEVDSQVLGPFMKQWRESWEDLGAQPPQVMAADAALFTAENLSILGELPWISRVPASIAQAKHLMQTQPMSQFQPFAPIRLKDYRFCEVCSWYGGVPQRWIMVASQPRLEADLKKLDKTLEQETKKQRKALDVLAVQANACEADALTAAQAFAKNLTFHQLESVDIDAKPHYEKQGRPAKDEHPRHFSFHVKAQLTLNPDVVQAHRTQAGRFIVATNILDALNWSNDKVLLEYKDQTCERGFRFLKDPLFFVSRLFLKSPKRIVVLMMVMSLALLVYAIGQRQMRQSLTEAQATLPDQKGKPTARPTLRWLCQCFLSVHLVWVDGIKTLIKLSDSQRLILQFLSPNSRKYYLLC